MCPAFCVSGLSALANARHVPILARCRRNDVSGVLESFCPQRLFKDRPRFGNRSEIRPECLGLLSRPFFIGRPRNHNFAVAIAAIFAVSLHQGYSLPLISPSEKRPRVGKRRHTYSGRQTEKTNTSFVSTISSSPGNKIANSSILLLARFGVTKSQASSPLLSPRQ